MAGIIVPDITLARVRERLNYNPLSGAFTWRVHRRSCSVGAKAGSVTRNGYLSIQVDSRELLAHRLAWFYTYGSWPVSILDHIDRDRVTTG